MSPNMNVFSESNLDVLKEFLHGCIDEICGYPGPTYQQFSSRLNWNNEEYSDVHKLLSSIIRNPMSLYITEDKMPQEFNELPLNVQENIISCLKIRRNQLTKALVMDYSKKQNLTMINFDWRLRLVNGSSKLAALREPLLQMDLLVADEETERTLNLELNKTELENFINTLETIS